MTVTLQLPSALAGYAGGRREIEIAVPVPVPAPTPGAEAEPEARDAVRASGNVDADMDANADAAPTASAPTTASTSTTASEPTAASAPMAEAAPTTASAPTTGAATTVAHVLDRLADDLPALERRIRDERAAIRRHVNIYVDGADIRALSGAETQVRDGATIDVIAAVSGG